MHAVARALEFVPVDPIATCYNAQFAALESIQNSIHTVRAEVFGDDAEIAVLRLIIDAQNVERKLTECAEF